RAVVAGGALHAAARPSVVAVDAAGLGDDVARRARRGAAGARGVDAEPLVADPAVLAVEVSLACVGVGRAVHEAARRKRDDGGDPERDQDGWRAPHHGPPISVIVTPPPPGIAAGATTTAWRRWSRTR